MSPTPPSQPLVTCGDCGAGNEPSRRKCRNCGADLSPPASGTGSTGALVAPTPRTGHDASGDAEPVPAPSRRKIRETPEEYAARRRAAIARIVVSAPPPTPQQIAIVRRIFGAAPKRGLAA